MHKTFTSLTLATTLGVVLQTPTSVFADSNTELFDWYGSIRLQLADTAGGNLELEDNYSRIGARGSVEMAPGITGTYNVEFRLHGDTGVFAGGSSEARLANIGLEGSFGSLLIGKQYSPLWNFTDNEIDVFPEVNESTGCTWGDAVCHTHRFGLFGYDGAGNGHFIQVYRPDRAITYTSPNINGFQGAAMVLLNNGDVVDQKGDAEDIVGYNAAASYSFGDFNVAITRFDLTALEGKNRIDALQVAYSLTDKLRVAAHWQKSHDVRFYEGMPATGETVEETVKEVYAGYNIGIVNLQLSYAKIDMDSPSGVEVETGQWLMGASYQLPKHGSFYATYTSWGDEAREVFAATNKLIVGYRFDF